MSDINYPVRPVATKEWFKGCDNLTSVDLQGIVTTNTIDFSSMFEGCSALTTLDVTSLDTARASNVTSMFKDCSSLPELDVSSFNTAKCLYMNTMFRGMTALERVKLGAQFKFHGNAISNPARCAILPKPPTDTIANPTWQGYTFHGYYTKTNGQGEQLIDEAGYLDNQLYGLGMYDYYSEDKSNVNSSRVGTLYAYWKEDLKFYAVLDPTNDTLYFIRSNDGPVDVVGSPGVQTIIDLDGTTYQGKVWALEGLSTTTVLAEADVPWHAERGDVKQVISFETQVMDPETTAWWFADFTQLTYADLRGFATDGTLDLTEMFARSTELNTVELGKDFSFVGAATTTAEQALLPTPAVTGYTGNWTDWRTALSAADLRDTYNGATMAGTWMWERVNFALMPLTGGEGQNALVAWLAVGSMITAGGALRGRKRKRGGRKRR